MQPTIISIHGGGWVYGDKERYQYYCMDLAQRGFTVVNFTYRLAPEFVFPAALEDINAVFQWVAQNGAKYRIDTDKVFVVGDSAGAQLASQYLTIFTSEEYRRQFSIDVPSDKVTVRAVALNCGMYEADAMMKEGIAKSYFEGDPQSYVDIMSATKYITKDFPAAYVMTSYYDFLKENAVPFYELLKEKGVYSEYKLYGEEGQEEMAHVFHLNIRMDQAKQCNDEECQFFCRILEK